MLARHALMWGVNSGFINSPLGNPLLRCVCWQPSPWGEPEGRGGLVGGAGDDWGGYDQKAERQDQAVAVE
eukprot:6680156-Pyramimonas_sp.AAC.1